MSISKMTDKALSTFQETFSFLETQVYKPTVKRKKTMISVLCSLLKMQKTSCLYTLEIHLFFLCSKMCHTNTSIVPEMPAPLTL